MAEQGIPVQPAGTQAQPPPAPLQLKVFTADGTIIQGVCLVDDQGRAYQVMTEQTALKLLKTLVFVAKVLADANGGLLPPDIAIDETT